MAKKRDRISEQIRRAIRDSGVSHRRISQRIGVTSSMMSRFMSGHVGMSLAALDRLGELLDLTITGPGPGAAKPSDFVDRRYKQHKGN